MSLFAGEEERVDRDHTVVGDDERVDVGRREPRTVLVPQLSHRLDRGGDRRDGPGSLAPQAGDRPGDLLDERCRSTWHQREHPTPHVAGDLDQYSAEAEEGDRPEIGAPVDADEKYWDALRQTNAIVARP